MHKPLTPAERSEYRAAQINRRIAEATSAFEAGFLSEAARKRALEALSRAYSDLRETLSDAILAARTTENDEQNGADYWAIPFDLHNVRDRHFEIASRYVSRFTEVRDLIALRAAIKGATIAPAPARPEVEVKAEKVRLSIMEEMERRKATFIEGLDITRLWNEMFPRKDGGIALPVTVNAHIVHGHKGAVFPRHFFYLRGKLTPLNTIIAIAEQLEKEAGL